MLNIILSNVTSFTIFVLGIMGLYIMFVMINTRFGFEVGLAIVTIAAFIIGLISTVISLITSGLRRGDPDVSQF